MHELHDYYQSSALILQSKENGEELVKYDVCSLFSEELRFIGYSWDHHRSSAVLQSWVITLILPGENGEKLVEQYIINHQGYCPDLADQGKWRRTG